MPGQTPTLEDVIHAAVNDQIRAAGGFQALPAAVATYHHETREAMVEVLINDPFVTPRGDLIYDSLPLIGQVPVVMMGGSEFGSNMPLKKGDYVLVVWASASIVNWKFTGKKVDPFHDARFHVMDCFAIPGIYPWNTNGIAPSTGTAVLGNKDAMTFGAITPNNNGPVVAITKTDVRLGDKDASDPVARKTDLDHIVGALKDANVAQAIFNYGIAVGGAKPAALAALVLAVTNYFTTNPVNGSPNVRAK